MTPTDIKQQQEETESIHVTLKTSLVRLPARGRVPHPLSQVHLFDFAIEQEVPVYLWFVQQHVDENDHRVALDVFVAELLAGLLRWPGW
jgi:hypothetical protein